LTIASIRNLLQAMDVRLLKKPFTPQALFAAVEDALSDAPL
jgi:hypothetical protein